ncbi:MarR family transcriptional regulator [Nocardia sp. CA2R105]|uniref:MarR family winged helix-turn-helix transcriptional regulator n=1 Tax=Nocardia coffeae TaxID=2873381 RepID=UPI001CA77F5F|nr:MarR family transcriptional regulator [Nocardia coffeae]MBY8863040.1 MarR family transcriptional regulator [Nocardia coffeae]
MEVEALSTDEESAWRSYLRSHALLTRTLDAELRAEHGMTLLTYDALVQLSEAPGQAMYMRNLAAALLYSASGLTRIVDGLEKSGYAERRIDPANRRATLVTLTPEGVRALQAAWPTHVRGVRGHFARYLGDGEAPVLRRVLAAVAQDLETAPAGSSTAAT